MNVVVTGANGFVGSHLVAELCARGHQVSVLVRRSSNLKALEGLDVDKRYGDVRDEASLSAAFAGAQAVVHVAGLTKGSPAELMRVNAEGAAAVTQAARLAGVRRLVFVSSMAASGPSAPDLARVESDPSQPVSHYGRSKHAGEERVRDAAGALELVIVRPPIVYGPGDLDVLEMIRVAALGWVVLFRRQARRYSVIHCRDLARGLALALERGRAVDPQVPGSGTYFLTDGAPLSWVEFGQAAGRAVGREVRVLTLPLALVWMAAVGSELWGRLRGRPVILSRDKIREGSAAAWWISTERARQELGYEPQVALPAGMAEAVAWARATGRL